MSINAITFESKLNKEILTAPKLVTEDLIRYWFILDQKLNFSDVEIEKQYKLLNKKLNNITINERSRIDLFYNIDKTALEIKFHKATSNSKNCTATKAGSLFRDFNRLSLLSYKDKYVIYVLDHNMLNYYKKAKAYQKIINNLANKKSVSNFDFGVMSVGSEFKKVAFSSFSVNDFKFFNYSVSLEHATQLKGTKYHLIIFKIN